MRFLRAGAALTLCLPGVAGARDANPEGTPVGQKAIALGGACTALGGDGTSLWYNPAGLGSLPGAGISANVAVYSWRTQKVESFVDWGIDQGRADAESGDFASIPSSLVYALPLFAEAGKKPQHGLAAGVFVPDDDTYDIRASSQVVGDAGAIQVKLSDVLSERSYWPGVGYGYDNGEWGLGVSAFAVAHTLKRQTVASLFVDGIADLRGLNFVQSLSTTDVTAVVQGGALYRPSSALTLGLTVRSPSLKPFYQSGETLVIVARDSQPAFLDRHESDDIKADHRLALRIAAGAAWQASPELTLTLDAHFNAALDKYTVIDGPILHPKNAAGRLIDNPQPADRVLNPDIHRKRNGVLNGALGGEFRVSPATALRGGFYTDMSAVPGVGQEDLMDYDANLYGIAFGVGFRGERGSTDLGLLVRRGTGTASSDYRVEAGTDHNVGSATNVEIFQVALFLGGTADL